MAEREIEKWVTVNGRHMPIYKDDGTKSVVLKNESIKEKQIAQAQAERDRLNGKKSQHKALEAAYAINDDTKDKVAAWKNAKKLVVEAFKNKEITREEFDKADERLTILYERFFKI